MTITVDRDQAGWGSSKIYDDGDLSGLWVPDKVVIHWGGSTVPPRTQRGERSLFRSWQRFHINTRRWRDIAYSYSVGNNAPLLSRRTAADRYRLRGWNPAGATSGDFEGDGIPENAEAVAVVWAGGSGGRVKAAAFEAMAIIVSEILVVIDADVDVVIGHRQVKGGTRCPGDEWIDWIRAKGWTSAPSAPPPGADPEEEIMIRAAMQAQSPDYYKWLQSVTTYPRGGDPGYWGRTGQSNGPADADWDRPTDSFATVLDELYTASLSAGALVPALPPPGPHGHDGTYAPIDHPHTIPAQRIT